MNRKDIIRMARKAGAVFPADGSYHRFESEESLQAFAALVVTNDTSQERVDETAKLRHDVLEEVALEFDKMKAFGDTAASFAAFVRDMKK